MGSVLLPCCWDTVCNWVQDKKKGVSANKRKQPKNHFVDFKKKKFMTFDCSAYRGETELSFKKND